jgi:hypothetical protein
MLGKDKKKREFALFFFRARRFRFFRAFFSSRFFLASRSRAQKREKSASALLCAILRNVWSGTWVCLHPIFMNVVLVLENVGGY